MTTKASSASPIDIPVMPCPFCGKKDTLEVITGAEFMDEDQEFYQHSESFAVVCNAATPNGKGGCGAMGGFADTSKAAIDHWNTRHNVQGQGRCAALSRSVPCTAGLCITTRSILSCRKTRDSLPSQNAQ